MLFHISEKDLGEKVTFLPRIPHNNVTDSDLGLEDAVTPRVSVAPTIIGCILAMDPIWKLKNKKYYLYRVISEFDSFVSNSEIIEKKLVFDAKKTREMWITEPVSFEKLGEIVTSKYFGNWLRWFFYGKGHYSFKADLLQHLDIPQKKQNEFLRLIENYEKETNTKTLKKIREEFETLFDIELYKKEDEQ